MQARVTVTPGTARRPRGADGYHEITTQKTIVVKHLPFQEGFHPPMRERLQHRIGQPTQHPVHGIQVRHAQFEQPSIVLGKPRFLAQVVEGIARALLKDEQREGRPQEFAQLILRMTPAVFDLPQALKHVREKVRDRFEPLAHDRLTPVLDGTC